MKGDFNPYALIMAGGQGTRFWPESTSKKPKQYLSLTTENSLLKETLLRFEGLVDTGNRFIVTVNAQKLLATDQSLGLVSKQGIILEPSGRNTAPCILLALAKLEALGAKNDDPVAIVPSDHVILNVKGFQTTLSKAYARASKQNKIVTIGIRPHFPHTGFGYIKKGEELGEGAFQVDSFVEKPSLEIATSYVGSGQYFWNGGMFVASLQTLKTEFEVHAPDMFRFYSDLIHAGEEKTSQLYQQIRKDSIDYAVMEKSKNVIVQEAEFDWNDLGSWEALESVLKKENENILISNDGSYIQESDGNIVFAPGKFVSLLGLKDYIVVDNKDVLMVLPKSRSQEVKKTVEFIKSSPYKDKLL